MSDLPSNAPAPIPTPEREIERTKQVTVAGWTIGFTAFVALSCVGTEPVWPAACAVTAVCGAVAYVCDLRLKR